MLKEKNVHDNETISIGDMAKKMNVTVRTLQYYDKVGLMTPSATTQGGRRFYIKSDMVRLHQILSMKYLGFSLNEIKARLSNVYTPQELVNALKLQKEMFKERINKLEDAVHATETLRQEVEQMKVVDFERCAQIILLLQKNSDSYWLFKLFNSKLTEHVNGQFSENIDAWANLFKRWESACDRTIILDAKGENPESQKAQALAKEWWDMTIEFLGGDLSLLPELNEFEEKTDGWNTNMKQKIPKVKAYRHKLLTIYLGKQGIKL